MSDLGSLDPVIRLAVTMILVLVFLFAIGAVGVGIVRMLMPQPGDPEKRLAERFANGEIDEAEYARRLSILRYGPPLELPD